MIPSKTLFKFACISLLSFFIDFLIFASLHILMGGLFFPLILARIISGSFNFYQNKVLVYKAKHTGRMRKEIISYILLAIIIFCFGYVLISLFVLEFEINTIVAKVIVDAILFLCSYLLQKYFIFFSAYSHRMSKYETEI